MAVKIADTLKALSNTFPVAECVDIDVNINGTTKRLQKAIDDGEIGGGSDSTWKGTHEEWEALSTEEKGKYEVICFTDDYDSSGIGCDSSWTGTKAEWEALSPTEKEKYEVVYFTDDYDGVIGESDSSWKGTLEEWETLPTEEKGKYEVVYFTNDYDDNRLIDDSNISNKTTYSSTKIENSLNNKANATDLTSHTSDTNIHVTTSDKTKWNKVNNKIDKTDIVDNLTSTDTNKPLSAKQGKVLKDEIGLKANATDLTSHTSDTSTHITTAERTKWNKVDNKVDKTDIVDNLTSTNTDKPLSANQGKILKGEIGLKANATDLTTHTSNTGIHVTTSDKTKWNKVDSKIDKASITTIINSASTDTQVPSAKAINDKVIKALGNLNLDYTYNKSDSMNIKLTRFAAYKFSAPEKGIPEANVGDFTLINIPWGMDTNSYSTTMEFANQLLFSPRKSDTFWYRRVWKYYEDQYVYTEGDYSVFGKWRTISSTGATDVPKTNIAPSDETKFIGFKGNSMCNYCVVNGVCYVSIWNVQVSVTGRSITGVMLPMPKSGFFGGGFLTGGGDSEPHAYAHIIPETGELKFNVKDVNTPLYGSFSYPVAE